MSARLRAASHEREGNSTKKSKPNPSTSELTATEEFEILQGYRKFEEDIVKGRVQVARTGDITIAVQKLETVDDLFSKVAGTRNNGLFAHDARAIVSISELAQLSVRSLKFDDSRSLVNIQDVLNSCKKFMLKEFFKDNQIVEPVLGISDTVFNENDINEEENRDPNKDHSKDRNTSSADKFRQISGRRNYLQQFSDYSDFNQFNWFKMGALYDSLSKNVATVDHMLGPFSLEMKVRAAPTRRARETVGALITAEKITQNSLNNNQDSTTPEQVKKCFKALVKKSGHEKISLFKFVLDPNSFAKSIENLFYTSFLIKEGRIVMEEDEEGLPCIQVEEQLPTDKISKEIENLRRRDTHQNHIIFQLDIPTWKRLVEKFNITDSFLS